MDDRVVFAEDRRDTGSKSTLPEKFWKVMVVDDDTSVHEITTASFRGIRFEDRGILFLNAFSGQEAMELLRRHPDTAMLLVDVVMETENAGLNFVHWVREKQKNDLVQIVIRTGQPGMAPESEVITKYKINGYYAKTDLNYQKMYSLFTTALRSFRLSKRLDRELAKRKKAEDELVELNRTLEARIRQRTGELERSNRLKTQFLANMSHEIRTPMNGVIGMSTLLMDEPLTPEQKEYAAIIHNSANSLLTIINDILDLSKIESGQLAFENRSFSVRMLLKELESFFRFKAEEKGIDFLVSASEDIPHFLFGDETRIKQILINLAGNAVKFTQKGFVKVYASLDKDLGKAFSLCFEVADSGPGIAESFQAQLFNKFSQADASISRKYGGTGLGLAISRHLANLMEGNIEFSNRPEGGAVFKVVLTVQKHLSGFEVPADKTLSHARKTEVIEKLSRLNLKILLAEDNPINRKVLLMMLKKMKLAATVAKNGEEVLERLKDRPYDLILMDVQMPDLDGIETTKIIRSPDSDISCKQIPIIALTAHAMPEDEARCLKAGMDRYLSKPIHPDKIVNMLADLFLN